MKLYNFFGLLVTSILIVFFAIHTEVGQTTNLRAVNITAYGANNQLNAQTALTNAVIAQLTSTASKVIFGSTKSGSAGYQPMYFDTNGSDQYKIDTSGNFQTAGGTTIITNAGAITGATLNTQSNCSSSSGSCSSAPSGAVTIAAGMTTVTVTTSAVTAVSNIVVTEDSTMGTRLSVTCNTTTGRTYSITAKTASTSFVITASGSPSVNPACLVYNIVN